MENIFGKYRTAAPLTTKSSHPIYRARLATDTEWNSAVKVYDTFPTQDTVQAQEDWLHKMETLRKLEHPHILSIIDYGTEKGIPYSVTTYMEHGSLFDRLNQASPVPHAEQDVITIALHIGRALQYAHEQHIFHGNIKPGNILFNEKHDALLADFYSSEPANDGHKTPSTYYPPSESPSEKSDQYALGSLAYELFSDLLPTGKHPSIPLPAESSEEDMATLNTSRVPSEQLEQIEAILLKAMAKEPDERFESMAEFVAAINALYPAQIPTAPTLIAPLPAPELAPVSHQEMLAESPYTPPLIDPRQWNRPAFSLANIYQMNKGKTPPRLLILVLLLFVLGALCAALFLRPSTDQSYGHTASSVLGSTIASTAPQQTQTVLTQQNVTATPVPSVNTSASTSTALNPQINVSPAPTSDQVTPSKSGTPTTSNSSHPHATPEPTAPPAAEPTPTPKPTAAPTSLPTSPPAPTPIPAIVSACHVTYAASNWNFSGFIANITITNTGNSAMSQWTLQWSFAGNQRITNAWNARVSQAGPHVTLSSLPWNGTIAPGSSVRVGVSGISAGNTADPGSFTLNNTACN